MISRCRRVRATQAEEKEDALSNLRPVCRRQAPIQGLR